MPDTPIRRALVSVSDKTGLAEFTRFLESCGVDILSTGGTAQTIREAGIAVTDVADPLVTAAFALALGSGMLITVIHRDVVRSLRQLPGRYIAICVLAGICTGLAVASLFQALSRAPVTVVSPIAASSPLFALLLAHLFLQRLESISLMLVLGTFLSVGGVVLVVLGASTA